MEVKNRRVEQGEATRAALVRTARALFAERGYAAVGTEEIVRAAGVTRGALYHHFEGKRDLFRAVFEAVEGELIERLGRVALGARDPFDAMARASDEFLDACLDPEFQRISLLDAPAVLEFADWRGAGLDLVQAALAAAMDAGQIVRRPVRPLAHILLGSLNEAALYVARADDVRAARREVGEIVTGMLAGLRAVPAPG